MLKRGNCGGDAYAYRGHGEGPAASRCRPPVCAAGQASRRDIRFWSYVRAVGGRSHEPRTACCYDVRVLGQKDRIMYQQERSDFAAPMLRGTATCRATSLAVFRR